MSALLDSLNDQFASSPLASSTGAPSRRAALEAAIANGLPTARMEAWKYTSLRALEQRQLALSAGEMSGEMALPESLPSLRLVFVNGRFDADRSTLDALPDGMTVRTGVKPDADALEQALLTSNDAALWQLNEALAEEGVLIDVADGISFEEPLHLLFISAESGHDAALHLSHQIRLGAQSRLELVEQHLGAGSQRHLNNHVSRIALGDGAQLKHRRIQVEASGVSLFARTRVSVAAAANYRLLSLELGAALSRHELIVDLEGEQASTRLAGLVRSSERQHVDTRLSLSHRVGNTASDTQWRMIAGGRSRAIFHGGIHIAAGADGSDAALQTRNLLLSEQAEIDAQPVLVIDAEEVKAAHGATVGQLDEGALYYLRSRGLPEAEARRLLVYAFCQSLLDDVDNESLRAELSERVKARLFTDAEARA